MIHACLNERSPGQGQGREFPDRWREAGTRQGDLDGSDAISPRQTGTKTVRKCRLSNDDKISNCMTDHYCLMEESGAI